MQNKAWHFCKQSFLQGVPANAHHLRKVYNRICKLAKACSLRMNIKASRYHLGKSKYNSPIKHIHYMNYILWLCPIVLNMSYCTYYSYIELLFQMLNATPSWIMKYTPISRKLGIWHKVNYCILWITKTFLWLPSVKSNELQISKS